MDRSPKPFDRKTWDAFFDVDPDLAAAAAYLRGFGEQYVDDLAESYLAIGEKRYLANIVAKLQRSAEADASTPRRADSDSPRAQTRRDPEFDVAKWNALTAEDADIAAAAARVEVFGNYYVADLAASYQALDDKRYLGRIVDEIIAQAQADPARPPDPSNNSFDRPQNEATSWTKSDDQPEGSPWGERMEADDRRSDMRSTSSDKTDYGASTEFQRGRFANWAEKIPRTGPWRALALAAVAIVFPLFVGTSVILIHEYSTFREAHGDVNQLEAYERQCRLCLFKRLASAETSNLKSVAAERENVRRREKMIAQEAKQFAEARGDVVDLDTYVSECEVCLFADAAKEEIARLKKEAVENDAGRLRAAAIAEDERNYQAARGSVDRLIAYLGGCANCAFKSNAEAELNQLRQQADIAATQARIAAQRKDPPRQVTWRMTNSTGLIIAVQFFSQTRPGQAWPGSNLNWPMTLGQTADYNLACQSGEMICYGVSAPYRNETWGVGGFGTQGCENCCVTCDGALHAVNLLSDGGGPNE